MSGLCIDNRGMPKPQQKEHMQGWWGSLSQLSTKLKAKEDLPIPGIRIL